MYAFTFSVALLSACGAGAGLLAQPSQAIAPLPEPGVSVIAMPFYVNLKPLLAEAEQTVPKVSPGADTWAPLPESQKPGMRLRFNLYRDVLSVRMNGPRLALRTLAHYWLEVGLQVSDTQVKPLGSCGQGKDGHRQVLLATESELTFTPNWDLNVKTDAVPPFVVSPCQLAFLSDDLTPQVVKGMQDEMADASADLGHQLHTTALLRQKAEFAWTRLAHPIELAPRLHLAMNPERIRLAPLATEGNRLVVTPKIIVRPTVTFGAAPAATTRHLPALEPSDIPIPPGLHIRIRADVSFDEATAQLARQLVGRVFETQKGSFQITEAKARGESGKALLEVTVKGRVKGRLTLTGKPAVDLATRTLQLRDLDFTVDSQSWITRNGEWLFRSPLRQMIQEKAHFALPTGFSEAREQVSQHLNRPLAPGLLLRGEFKDMHFDQAQVLADRFRLEGNLEGQVNAEWTDPVGLSLAAAP